MTIKIHYDLNLEHPETLPISLFDYSLKKDPDFNSIDIKNLFRNIELYSIKKTPIMVTLENNKITIEDSIIRDVLNFYGIKNFSLNELIKKKQELKDIKTYEDLEKYPELLSEYKKYFEARKMPADFLKVPFTIRKFINLQKANINYVGLYLKAQSKYGYYIRGTENNYGLDVNKLKDMLAYYYINKKNLTEAQINYLNKYCSNSKNLSKEILPPSKNYPIGFRVYDILLAYHAITPKETKIVNYDMGYDEPFKEYQMPVSEFKKQMGYFIHQKYIQLEEDVKFLKEKEAFYQELEFEKIIYGSYTFKDYLGFIIGEKVILDSFFCDLEHNHISKEHAIYITKLNNLSELCELKKQTIINLIQDNPDLATRIEHRNNWQEEVLKCVKDYAK